MDSPLIPATPSTLDAGTEAPHLLVEAEAPQPQPPSTLRRIFYGPFGLRAGWSLLIYFAILITFLVAVRLTHDAVTHKGRFAPATHQTSQTAQAHAPTPAPPAPRKAAADAGEPILGIIIQESIVFALVFFMSWIMKLIERRRLSAFGLGGVHSIARFFTGALYGFLAMALLIAMLRFGGFLSFDTRLDHGLAIPKWAALQLIAFLLVGLFEEYLFRGYIQFTLTRGLVGLGNLISRPHARAIAFWCASVITSAIFLYAHTHNAGETKFGLFTVFLAGLLFVVALWRTGSLWWAIGFHMAWDWSQSFLYGVPDSGGLMQGRLFATHALGNPLLSGGTVGPEGSVLVAVPLTLSILVLIFLTNPSPQPPLEPLLPARATETTPTFAPQPETT